MQAFAVSPALWQPLAINGGLVALVVLGLALLPMAPAPEPSRRTQLTAGALFGAVALLAMQAPLLVGPSISIDMRGPVMAISAFSFGPLAGAVTAGAAALYRIAIGGPALPAALGVLASTVLIGWAWRVMRQRRHLNPWPTLLGLALSHPLVAAAWALALPAELRANAPMLVVLSAPLLLAGGTLLLGGLVELVLDRARDAHRLRTLYADLQAREQALRASQDKFSAVYHALPDAAGITRISDGRYVDINPAFTTLTGHSREAVLGRSTMEVGIWADDVQRQRLVAEYNARGQVDGLELVARSRDGELIPGSMSARRIDVAGEPCFAFLFHDLRRQKAADEELREAHGLLQAAERIATLGVWEISPESGRHYWSPIVYDIHALPHDQPVPDDYIERFVAAPYRAALRGHMHDCVVYRRVWEFEMEVLRLDGRQIWIRVLGEPVVHEDRVRHMRGVVQDIDEARRNLQRLQQSEELFSRMFQLMPDPMGISRQRTGQYLEVNPAWESWLGHTREQALGRSVVELGIMREADRDTMMQRAGTTGQLMSWEVALTTRAGEQRVGLQSMRAIDIEGEACWLFGVRDITERRRSEALVREREELLSLTVEAASLGLWDCDVAAGLITGDARWYRLRGLPADHGPATLEYLRSSVHADDAALIPEAYQRHLRDPAQAFDVVRRVITPQAQTRWIRSLGRVIARDDAGRPLRMVGVDIDVTREREQELQLQRLAHFDALTGLPNRVLLADRLQHAMAQALRSGTLLGVAYLDLDGFKPVNDRFGHGAGDRLLVDVANRLKEAVRAIDSVARLGGDEFVLLLTEVDSAAACEQALQRIMGSLAQPYPLDGEHVTVTASIGTTLYPSDRSDADTLLRHADQAMYLAKQAGRNRIQVFDSAQERASRDRQRQLDRLREALDAGEFTLYMQPKVDMQAGRAVGAEALARWNHPQEGVLSPAHFLPLIEGSELGVAFGEWVIDAALAQLDAWQAQGLVLPLSINISARHLQSGRFAEDLTRRLAAHPRVNPRLLEIEVTESVALTDFAGVIEVLEALRGAGVKVALDDFGTGYSSLTYLRRLPIDTLKIDQSFVHGMMGDGGDLAIVQGVIGLAHSFRRTVVAEGVETPAQGATLLRLGCRLAQGYGIARPMPAEALPAWVASWRPTQAWQSPAATA